MAAPFVQEALKLLTQRVTSSKTRARIEALRDVVTPAVIRKEFPEPAVKLLMKLLSLTVERYRDTASQRAVEAVIRAAVEHHPSVAVKYVSNAVSELAQSVAKVAPSAANGSAAYTTLRWACVIVEPLLSKGGATTAEFKQLITNLADVSSAILASPRKPVHDASRRCFFRLFNKITVEPFLAAIVSLPPTQQSLLCLVHYIVLYAGSKKDHTCWSANMAPLLDVYMKSVVQSKSQVPEHIKRYSTTLLSHLTHEQFKDVLLPSLEKGLLRAPEHLIPALSSLLAGMSLDLSAYVMSLGKRIASQLYSQTASRRDEAVKAIISLSKQCSDVTAVTDFTKHLFAILAGAEGKLTASEQRVSVLSAIGAMAGNTVVGASSIQPLIEGVIKQFLPILQQEVHEQTLSHAIMQLAAWTQRLPTSAPADFLAAVKKNMSLKSASSPVRFCYLHLLSLTMKGNLMSQGSDVLPILSQAMERAVAQPHQVPVVSEAIAAASLLCQLSLTEPESESKYASFWKVALDCEKALLMSEKVISSATDDALLLMLNFLQCLLFSHEQRLDAKCSRMVHTVIVWLLVHHSYPARKRAATIALKIVKSSAGGVDSTGSGLRKVFGEYLTAQVVATETSEDAEGASSKAPKSGSSHHFVKALRLVTTPPSGSAGSIKDECTAILLESLLWAHHPVIVQTSTDEWSRLLQRLRVDLDDLVAPPHLDTLLACISVLQLSNQAVPSPVLSAVSTLSSLCPKFIGVIMTMLSGTLDTPLQVTVNEMRIAHTPEGQLFDTSLIDNAKATDTNKAQNIKRESKLYSYEDQKWEMEFREELKKKKQQQQQPAAAAVSTATTGKSSAKPGATKTAGKGTAGKAGGKGGKSSSAAGDVQLSKKQQEILEATLKQESATRKRVTEIETKLITALSFVGCAATANPYAMQKHMPQLVTWLRRLLRCPLGAGHAADAWVKLRPVAFDDEEDNVWLGKSVSHVTLRLLDPPTCLDESWEEEPLLAQAKRVLVQLHSLASSEQLPAASFCYCFPMLDSILGAITYVAGVSTFNRVANQLASEMPALMNSAISSLSIHCTMRSAAVGMPISTGVSASLNGMDMGGDDDEDGPALLPSEGMFRLLVHVIGNATDVKLAKLQQKACNSLVALCESFSSKSGCASLGASDLENVLLPAMKSNCDELRRAVLNGLTEIIPLIQTELQNVENNTHSLWGQELVDSLCCHVWLLRFDEVEINKTLAERLWDAAGMLNDFVPSSDIIKDVSHAEAKVRSAAAQALSASLALEPQETFANCQLLFELYEKYRYVPKASVDSMGRPTGPAPEDPWPSRCGVAIALRHLTSLMQSSDVPELFTFYVPTALNDHRVEVRKEMLAAATAAIEEHGKDEVSVLLPKFEHCLSLPDGQTSDALRQSIVILMGTLARHLVKEDPKIRPIVERLIATLDTPSQPVQEAVANCLPPLVPAIKDEAKKMVADLLAKLLDGTQFAERKGAAYGLAGLVKGLGIGSLKQLNIMPTLTEAVQNKKNYRHREGALFALEMLCLMLGRLFEPYIIHVLPHLLMCFGDGNTYVREAVDDTARAVMQKLSAHGVKLVLPSLLQAIEDDSWRTKIGSVELLGAMAYCAPKQLSSCLPSIVPSLTGVLADSHIKVQKAGGQALKQIGSVIKNPEIQVIATTLLEALADPATHTAAGLQALMDTAFVHMIDAPSLALIMPILQRALDQRSTDIKKMACQIMGSMYTLTDHKDLSPYLSGVLPGVKASLLDPLPEVRGVAAKALGAMVKGHGDESFAELMPWLLEVLTSESNTVDRSGSAQGMSEVLGSQGLGKLRDMMPTFVSAAQQLDASPHYRDGYLMLFVYLPVTFGDAFVPFIKDVIPPILKGLADESEYVRETALRGGQRIINMFADTAVEIFLPELEAGMFDEHWRIRHSSMQLLGDLLYRLSGVTGKMTTEGDEDEGFGTETSQKAILEALGSERRNRVLAGVYMGRSDVALLVRQAALHVWKVVVANTPRTLREILPMLFQLLLGCLASTSYDKRQVAARTLGDLVRKLGERVLPDIIPILERGLDSKESDERQGVCIGLTEIMSSTSRDQVLQFVDSLVSTVRRALCDELAKVRKAAAQTFDRLHATIGHQALQQILPPLLDMLSADGDDATAALDGLQQVMAVKSKDVLPFLIPKLTAPPVNSRALALLASVAGESLTRHIGRILQALLDAIETATAESGEQELANAQLLVLSIVDEVGVQTMIEELLASCKHVVPARRKAAASLLQVFAAQTRADILDHVPQLMRGLLKLFADPDKDVLVAAWDALSAVTKTLSAPDQLGHIGHLRQAVKYVADDAIDGLLPGFCLGPKKGIAPVLPMLREGLLNGPPELKEQAASGLSEVISLTTAESLKTSVVPIAGPLIRILGDRFVWSVKVAVLDALRILITKVGAVLKPFLPQLQTTFIKALYDTNRSVRQHASSALQCLVVLHARVDPLFTEMHNGIKTVDDAAVRETILVALRGVLLNAGHKMSEALRKSLTATLVEMLSSPEDEIRAGASSCVGAVCKVSPAEDLTALVRGDLLATDSSGDWTLRHGTSLALAEATSQASGVMEETGLRGEVIAAATTHSKSDRIPICLAGVKSLGHLWSHTVRTRGASTSVEPPVHACLATCLSHSSGEVRVAAARGIRSAARQGSQPVSDITSVIPALTANAREKASPAKMAAELALVSILKLRDGDAVYQSVSAKLDGAAATQLTEVYKRSLTRLAKQEDVDDDDDGDSGSFV
eukprot:scpid3464/ scgid26544/ Translational activator GCN1; GCN1-like protein 1